MVIMVASIRLYPWGINNVWVVVTSIDIKVGSILVIETKIKIKAETRMETEIEM